MCARGVIFRCADVSVYECVVSIVVFDCVFVCVWGAFVCLCVFGYGGVHPSWCVRRGVGVCVCLFDLACMLVCSYAVECVSLRPWIVFACVCPRVCVFV